MEQTLRQRAEALLELASKANTTPWFSPANAEFKAKSDNEAPYLAQKLIEALDVIEWYADKRNYRQDKLFDPTVYTDEGTLARQFLQERSE